MRVLGIDPAPAKQSIIFDGEKFLYKTPKELKSYIDDINEKTFIAWDAPLSAALSDKDFSLTIRQIERFFYRQGRYAKELNIPKGVSTLGYSSCPHWTVSQYIFGHPVINKDLTMKLKWELVMDSGFTGKSSFQISEAHPALGLWILLRDELKDHNLFKSSWQYKGYSSSDKDIVKRKEVLIDKILSHSRVKGIVEKNIRISTDDELDAFMCYILAHWAVNDPKHSLILGDEINGSFLLPNFECDDIIASFETKSIF
jgi:hypothetical protein